MYEKKWSKLQSELYKIIADEINLQVHCAAYPMDSQMGSTNLPRYWITLDKEIILDYPKQFMTPQGHIRNLTGKTNRFYPYNIDISDISTLIREYIDTPKEEILMKQFANDHWGLINILRAADRRVGSRRLESLKRKTHNRAALIVIKARQKQTPIYER